MNKNVNENTELLKNPDAKFCPQTKQCTLITYTSTGILNSRGNTAPSSFRFNNTGSRSSMMLSAAQYTADRPEDKDYIYRPFILQSTFNVSWYSGQ